MKRRKVIQGTFAYAVVGWLVIQLAIALEDALDLPTFVDRWATLAIIAGLPVAVLLSWFFDFSLRGIQLTGRGPAALAWNEAMPVAAAPHHAPTPSKSIAVLPFVDMSAEGDQAYLGDGVAEEILNALVKVTPLKVAGRTSSFSFKGRDLTVTEIGESLNVAYVLEGSVRRQGNRARVTAQLIQVQDGFHVWSDSYDGDLTDIFDLQDRIAKSIIAELEIRLEVDQVRLAASLTSSADAYDAFLQGRQLAQRQVGDGVLASAIELLERATRLDPRFAEAWTWLSLANFFIVEHTATPRWKEHLAAGIRAAREAYRINPDLSDVNLAMAIVHQLDLDFDKQWETRKRAYDLDPASVAAMHELGMAYGCLGLSEQAVPYLETATAGDPFSPICSAYIGVVQWILGDVKAAEASFDRSVGLGVVDSAIGKGQLMVSSGKPREAYDYTMSTLDRMRPIPPGKLRSRLMRKVYFLAVLRKVGWAKWLAWRAMRRQIGNPRVASDLSLKGAILYLGQPEAFFREVRERPNTYLSGAIAMLWHPTEEARTARTHPDFPRFAEEIGLVRAWQRHGWPPQVQPEPGTDGSGLRFTCS